jgi:glycerol-3-phosphate dehydrogenase
MWPLGSREAAWERLGRPWDVIVIGGGIVGAGIAREAAQQGLSVLLLNQGDFSSGTSSRSSKFVHGGLRYLKNRSRVI